MAEKTQRTLFWQKTRAVMSWGAISNLVGIHLALPSHTRSIALLTSSILPTLGIEIQTPLLPRAGDKGGVFILEFT